MSDSPLAYTQAKSRGIVLFVNGKFALWEAEHGGDVIEWIKLYSKPGTPHANFAEQYGGILHYVVWTVVTGFVIYEKGV